MPLHLPRSFVTPCRVSYNPERQAFRFGLCSVSLAATQEIAFAFSSSGYLDVSVPRVCLQPPYVFRWRYCSITSSGFPHSEISGSKLTYSSPKHIGVSPVLHRLLVPRHPPCALSNLTYIGYHHIEDMMEFVILGVWMQTLHLLYLLLSSFQGTNPKMMNHLHVLRECSLKTKQDRLRNILLFSLERR